MIDEFAMEYLHVDLRNLRKTMVGNLESGVRSAPVDLRGWVPLVATVRGNA